MSSDYIISYTDPANGSFVIKPSSTNGPLSPIATTPLDPQATAANTSIVLLGKGMAMYGERFEKSVVHMLEHFAYKTRPAYAIQGQLWYKNLDGVDVNNPSDPINSGLYLFDGSVWNQVLSSGSISSDLDMAGHKITNLGDPTVPSDAANALYVNNARDTRVAKVGDTMTGLLTLSGDPTTALQAATKQYVDTAVASAASVTSFNTRTGAVVLLASDVTTALTYAPVNKAGDTMTGLLTLSGAPTSPLNAATKAYVDAAISGAGAVTSFNSRTGTVLLNSTDVTNALTYTPVNKAGDTMTGTFVLNADPVNPLEAATKQYVDATATAGIGSKVNKTGDTMTGFLTLVADPITALNAATKNYVDSSITNAITGLDFKQSVRLATTANIPLDNTTGSIDSVTWANGDRILVKSQTASEQNGIYVASTAAGTWLRSADANNNTDVNSGMYAFVEQGTINASTGWVLATANPITLDTTPLTFTQFSGGGLGYVPVNKAGDTMTGLLTLSSDPASALQAATKQYVDNTAALKVSKSGDTMSGVLNMGSNKVTSVTDPTSAQDAATKNYVDTTIAASGLITKVSANAVTVNNSVTQVPLDNLVIPLTAGTYAIEAFVRINQAGTIANANLRLGFTLSGTLVESDGYGNWIVCNSDGSGVTASSPQTNLNSAQALLTIGDNKQSLITGSLFIKVSGAGNLTLNFAQETNLVTNTTAMAGSWLKVSKSS